MGIIGSHVDLTSGGGGHQANQQERCEWAEFVATPFRFGREVELAGRVAGAVGFATVI